MFRNLLHRSRNTANVAIIPNNVNCMYRNRITINLNVSKTSALVSCQAIANSFFGDQVFGYNYNSRRHFNSGINIFSQFDKIKVLGTGELTAKVDVTAHAFSESAKKAIEAVGGTVTTL